MLPFLLDNRKVDTERLNEILSYLHLEDRRTYLPSQLSGGQQQRVSAMNRPGIWIGKTVRRLSVC